MSWWEFKCKAICKNGEQCKNYPRRPFEIEKGNLYIPMTCWRHENQEKQLRELKIKTNQTLQEG
jgi:hypothetical protein